MRFNEYHFPVLSGRRVVNDAAEKYLHTSSVFKESYDDTLHAVNMVGAEGYKICQDPVNKGRL